MSDLLNALLNVPTPPPGGRRTAGEGDFSSKLEVSGDTAEVTLRADAGVVNEGTALKFLQDQGLDPSQYEVASFKRSEWGSADKPMESTSFTFRKVGTGGGKLDIDELIAIVEKAEPNDWSGHVGGGGAYVVAIGDMQYGKADGDGVEGSLKRTIDCLDKAAYEARRLGVEHVHIAWLGDHIEGFVSQGGANAWRTTLTLSEQIRLTRRVMLHALQIFAPLAPRVTMAAVPGNHGEPQRFAGKGVTRYDDSHDTEALVAVADAARLNPQAYGHVEFYVPDKDEMTVVLEVGGVTFAHAHGHQWRPGKQFEWWKGQAFGPSSPLTIANVLLAGHLHHLHIEKDGPRTFIGVPSLESESTWFRHSTGSVGAPGIVGLRIAEGEIREFQQIGA